MTDDGKGTNVFELLYNNKANNLQTSFHPVFKQKRRSWRICQLYATTIGLVYQIEHSVAS